MRTIQVLMCTAVLLAANLHGLAKEAKPNPFKERISAVTPLDLPNVVASLVASAPEDIQQMTTIQVMDAAVAHSPAATPVVVSAIAKVAPNMAPIAAARGAALQKGMVSAITRAAALAAPKEAGKIVYSVCRSVPSQYQIVAKSAARAVPGASNEIISAVALAIPSIQPIMRQAATQVSLSTVTVPELLDKTMEVARTSGASRTSSSSFILPESALVMPPPTVGPPFLPLTGVPDEIGPDDSDIVPPGMRPYARP